MDSPVKLGMTLEQVQAALHDLCEVEVQRGGDAFSDSVYVKFELDRWEHNAHLDEMYGVGALDHIWATRSLQTFGDALEWIEELVTKHGSPDLVWRPRAAEDSSEMFKWEWRAGPQITTVSLCEESAMWLARIDLKTGTSISVPVVDLTAAREMAAAVDRHLAGTSMAEGSRGVALARWLEMFRERRDRLERFLDLIAIVTPRTPISVAGIPQLVEQAGWFARHRQLFAEPDDWRDALVVQRDYQFDLSDMGWHVHHAREGECNVLLVEGPFATGVHRVLRSVDEIYPILDVLPVAEVTVTVQKPTYREDGMEKRRPNVTTASIRDVTVELSGFGDELERVARLLAALRAR